MGEINVGTYNNLKNYFLVLTTMFNINVPERKISKPEIMYAQIKNLYSKTKKIFFKKYTPGIVEEISLLRYLIDKKNYRNINILKLINKKINFTNHLILIVQFFLNPYQNLKN